MSFLQPVAEADATEDVAALYAEDRAALGYVANFTRTFSLQPSVMRAWQQLNGSIKSGMDLRRYELATVAAARRLRSSYCALAHGRVLSEKFLSVDETRAVASDHHDAGLSELDVAIMDFAEQVAADASVITAEHVDRLRALGCSDTDVLDVVLAAAARAFFSKVLDATGTLPDAAFAKLDPALREALTVGRPIETV